MARSTPASPAAGCGPSALDDGLRCFKCGGGLRVYHRSGIVLEQCQDCRGIFLDGGELERLIDAEGGGWSGRVGAPPASVRHDHDGEPMACGRAPAGPTDRSAGPNGRRPRIPSSRGARR